MNRSGLLLESYIDAGRVKILHELVRMRRAGKFYAIFCNGGNLRIQQGEFDYPRAVTWDAAAKMMVPEMRPPAPERREVPRLVRRRRTA